MTDIEYLAGLARAADAICREELGRSGIPFDHAEIRVYDRRSVGVMGDFRTYQNVAEIEIRNGGNLVWDDGFLRTLSSRIPNEVKGINRVVYALV